MVTLTTSICSVLFLVLATSASARQNVYVDTKVGRLKGVILGSPFQEVSAFLRIPFAEPPVGDLRFKKPVPYKKKGDIDATSFPPACIQHNQQLHPRLRESDQDEDCLYLNVYVPGRLDPRRQTSPRKTVMVWIHGGSFSAGSIREDNSMLASFGDVIVVNVAYRLGVFGFMTPNESNNGLFDQRLGLKWVYDNIDCFGGDKNSITIFGQSAGAISIGFHLLSDGSVKYFKRAIFQSGAAFDSPSDPVNIRNVIKLIPECDQQDHQQTLECLQSVSVDKLKDVHKKLLPGPIGISPKKDGDFLKDSVKDSYQKDPFVNHPKEILVGINAMEGAYFIAKFPPFKDLFPIDGPVNQDLTWDDFKEKLKKLPPTAGPFGNQKAIQAADFKSDDSPQIIAEKYSQVVGDQVFVCPVLGLVTAFTQKSSRPVYFYEYYHRPSNKNKSFDPLPWAKPAIHGDELRIVSGEPFLKKDDWNDDERQLSKSIMSMWTTFAKNGRPKNDSNTWIPIQGKEFGYFKIKTKSQRFVSGLPDNICSALR